MKKFLLTLIFTSSMAASFSLAADNPSNLEGYQGGGAHDLLGVTRFPTEISNQPSTVQFNLTCRDDNGTEFQEGQRGFAHCMEQSKKESQKKADTSKPSGR